MFQTPYALRNNLQRHECNNQNTSRAHFTGLMPIYNKLALHYLEKDKRNKEMRE